MKHLLTFFFLLAMTAVSWAGPTYYVSPTGSNSNAGTKAAPFSTLRKALETVGTTTDCTIYILPGEYDVTGDQFMDFGYLNSAYAVVYPVKADGTKIIGVKDAQGNRPVLNFTNATYTPDFDADGKPTSYYRISAFWLYGNNLTLKDFEITHVQSLYTGKTQSECISARRGSNCLVENIAMHDGMAIGYYQTNGNNNTIRNCDAYNIWDSVGYGGNGEDSDGFGFHLGNTAYTGTRVINCRAWWCGDDGFDCINNKAAISFEGCWAFYNGYQPGGNTSCGNGNGFKIGGYGKPATGYPDVIPSHTVRNCVAFYNKANGFYANHHLAGNTWENNTAMYNNKNFDMCNYSLTAADDVKGYGHVLRNNVSYDPRTANAHWTTIDESQCTLENNRVIADNTAATANFLNCTRLSPSNMYKIDLAKPRKANGELPDIQFLVAKAESEIAIANQGAMFETVPVILTAGQSNTDGRLDGVSAGEQLPSYLQTANQYAQVSYHQPYSADQLGKFVSYFPTSNATGQPKCWAYDAVTYYYIGQALKSPFYVAKTTYGGTSIDPTVTCSPSSNAWAGINCLPQYGSGFHWSADADFLAATDIAGKDFTVSGTTYTGQSLLKAWIANIDATIDALAAKGQKTDIKCMIWHQGESDRTVAANYQSNLAAMINYVRQHLVDKTGDSRYATLPFFCGTVPRSSKQYNAKIEAALYALEQADDNFHVISLLDVNDWRSDGVHFTAQGSELFGKRLYNSLIDNGIFEGDRLDDVAYAKEHTDFGDEKAVTLETSWSFNDYTASQVIADNLVEINGLYLRATSGHTITGKIGTTKGYDVTWSDDPDNTFHISMGAYSAGYDYIPSANTTAGAAVTTGSDRCFALNVNVPGTFRVIVAPSGNTDGRALNLWFNGQKVATVTAADAHAASNHIKELSFTTTTAGTYYITSSISYFLYAAKFTPTEGEEEAGTPVIHICGDSMSSIYGDQSNDASATKDYTNGMRGWGQFLQDYISTESGVMVQDWAHTGTTAKGFYNGANYWPVVMGTKTMTDAYKLERPYVKDYVPVKKGDYVFIVFGHNDQKGGSLHNGYKTVTESEYTTYLTNMVNEVKAKGAFPVLGTSICRALFKSGELTALGRIDACEAAGETHSDDCQFDYPAAVRRLATELNVPCLDLNMGSKLLWEDFGQSLTASVFFPNGGTTHTSETGARAMGIYANNTIRSWNDEDLNGAGFANYSRLIDAMKSGVTQYNKADYASQETKVSEETLWRFDNQGYADKDTIATSIVELNGLFLRATDTKGSDGKYNRSISVRTGNTPVDFLDSPSTMYARVPAGNFTGIDATSTAGMTKSNTTTPVFALNTVGPGTLYVSMATENTSAEGRYLKIMFDGEDKVSVATTTLTAYSPTTLSCHADKGGTFFFGGTVAYRVFAVKYVPDADDSEEELHEVSVTIPASGIGTLTNCKRTHALSLPEGLTAWAATEYTSSNIIFTSVEGIPAHVGVVIKGTPNETYSLTPVESDIEIPEINFMQPVEHNMPLPQTTTIDEIEYMNFILSAGAFYKSSGNGEIAAGKAYLSLPVIPIQETKSLSIIFDNEKTGINTITMNNAPCTMYNLAGQRINNSYRGIYILSNKKYTR